MSIPIVEIVVIKVVQRIYVRDPRIRDVHVAEIISTGVIPRTERFAESQREPTDSSAKAAIKTEAKSPPHKADERRAIEWPLVNGSRAPTPSAAYECPASVVIRRKAPWLIIHPSPAPRANPVPISIAIGRPADSYRAGIPNRTVVRLFSP